MSTRIGYVLKSLVDPAEFYVSVEDGTTDIQQATVFNVLGKSAVVPVRVTEEPGPPIREVVELRGTVDHGSLIGYALWKPKYFWMHHCWTSDIAKAEFSRSIATLAQIVNSFPFSDDECEIVGIREVLGPTVRKIEEIVE